MTLIATPVRALDRVQHGLAVPGRPQPRGPDRRDRGHAERLRLVGHAGDRDDGPLERLGDDLAARVDPLAEAGDLGAIDDGVERARRRRRSATWNLIELVPTSMTA